MQDADTDYARSGKSPAPEDVRAVEDNKWLNSLRSAVIGPTPALPRCGKGESS